MASGKDQVWNHMVRDIFVYSLVYVNTCSVSVYQYQFLKRCYNLCQSNLKKLHFAALLTNLRAKIHSKKLHFTLSFLSYGPVVDVVRNSDHYS